MHINKWMRLWIATAIIYLWFVLFVLWFIFPTKARFCTRNPLVCNPPTIQDKSNAAQGISKQKSDEQIMQMVHDMQLHMLVNAGWIWMGPMIFIYILGCLANWVYKGFQPNND